MSRRRCAPLVGHGALSPEGQAAFDRNSGLLGDAYHALLRQGIEEGSIAPIEDIEARALMLPGLVSWLVKEDVPRDLAQQRHIAREVANLSRWDCVPSLLVESAEASTTPSKGDFAG